MSLCYGATVLDVDAVRAGGQRPGNPTPAVAGRWRGALSHISGRQRLRDFRHQQPAGLVFSGLPAGRMRHLGCSGPSTAAGGVGWTPWATSTTCNSAEVRIRSLADNEQSWAQYLDADPDSPESFLGYTLAGFAAWVSDQELVSIRRRTKAGLEKAKADGKKLGAPRRLSEEQEGRGYRDGSQRSQPAARRQVLRRIACDSQARSKASVAPVHRAPAMVMRSVFQGAVVSTGVDRGRGAWWRWQCYRRGVRCRSGRSWTHNSGRERSWP